MTRWALACALAACGRLGFDATPADVASAAHDACAGFGPFAAPVLLPGPVDAAGDDAQYPVSALGETALVFYSYRAPSNGAALWLASRLTPSGQFGDPARIVELDAAGDQKQPALTADALDMIFTDASTAPFKLVETTRATTAATWSAPVARPELTTTGGEQSAWLSADGLRVVFMSGRNSPVNHIYEATRSTRGGAFAAPDAHPELDSTAGEDSPGLTSDGLTIFFSSGRGAVAGILHFYTARRAALDQSFGTPQPIAELTTPNSDLYIHLSRDDTLAYLNYNLAMATVPQVFVATRACM